MLNIMIRNTLPLEGRVVFNLLHHASSRTILSRREGQALFATPSKMRRFTEITGTPQARCFALTFALLIGLLGRDLLAADSVVYATGRNGEGRATVTGTVVDYAGGRLTLQSAAGGQQIIPGDRVVEVRTQSLPAQVAANESFRAEEFDDATQEYLQAFRDENRAWVRRQIMARCVECFSITGQTERAGDAFLQLVRSDPATHHFEVIPLGWRTIEPSAALERRALAWLNDARDPISRLIGASWLLPTRHRAKSIEALRQLKSDEDSRVALLATAQVWRTEVVTVNIAGIERWQETIQRIPEPQRAGPYYVLGLALARHQRHDHAAVAFMRIPVLYATQRRLAVAALLSAGRELERISHFDEAANVYREAAERYSELPEAAEAARRLERMEADGK